jgi:PAS domain S-box-containing protein
MRVTSAVFSARHPRPPRRPPSSAGSEHAGQQTETHERLCFDRRDGGAVPTQGSVSTDELFQHAPCGIHSLDRSGVFLAINDTELTWLGYERADIVGRRRFQDLLTPASKELFSAALPDRPQGPVWELELDVTAKDGRILTLFMTSTPVFDDEGAYVGCRSVVIDLTSRVRAERERDRFFALTLDILAISSGDGYFKRFNPAFTATLGWDEHELLSRPFIEFVHPDDREATRAEVERQVKAGQKVLRFENRYQHKDGSWRWLSWTSVPQSDGLMYATARDVTQLRHAETMLRTSEQKLAVTLDSIGDGVIATDTHGHITRINPVAERLLACTKTEAVGRPFTDVVRLIDEDTRQAVPDPVSAVLTTAQARSLSGHTALVARNGRETPVADSASPIRDPDGAVVGVVVVFRDVTAERAAAQRSAKLLKDLNDIRSALDAHSMVSITDSEGRITSANDRFTSTFGYSREELTGRDHSLIRSGYHSERFYDELWATIRAGRIWKGEVCNRSKDGRLGWYDTTIVPFVNADGSPSQFISIQTDITERRRAEAEIVERTRQLQSAREAAEAANRAKSAFLANMSHEIRTPLNAITGMVELLDVVTDKEERARMLRVTRDSARALVAIIDDILDFSKIEAGHLDVHLEPISLREVIQSAVEAFTSSASAKNLYLRFSCDPDLPTAVRSDALRLRQILFNLLGNAIKFTSSGGIDLRVEVTEQDASHAIVRIVTSDTGIGITPEAQARLFQPFVQAEATTTRRFGGTGLGLAISQRLAQMLGGTLSLYSVPGRGTTVTLTLALDLADVNQLPAPTEARADLPAARAPRAGADRPRLLLVDDSEINRDVLHRQVSALGYDADEAANGREALTLWQSRQYALVVADCHMPGMDGYELARSIRRQEAADPTRRRTPILGYTANASENSRRLCTEAGMDDALIKPVSLGVLGNTLAACLATAPPLHGDRRDSDDSSAPVDWSQLHRITGDDTSFAREILRGFVAIKTDEAIGLSERLAYDNLPAIAADAHRLKGGARSVAAGPLADVLEAIEEAARAGDRTTAAAYGPSLRTEFDRLAAATEELPDGV